jgi:hypothetical protein
MLAMGCSCIEFKFRNIFEQLAQSDCMLARLLPCHFTIATGAAAAAAVPAARYNGCWRWSTDGSRSLQHHLLLDTTAGSLQDNLRQVLWFVAEVKAASSARVQQRALVAA